MNKKEFKKLLDSVCTDGTFDLEKIKGLTNEQKNIIINSWVRDRLPIMKDFINSDTDESWLACMGYMQTVQGKRFEFLCTSENASIITNTPKQVVDTVVKSKNMKDLETLLEKGESYFGSGSYNSEEFNKFFTDFKRIFTKYLLGYGATEIEMSKGHFYLSGFFRADNGQMYYFSLSDVRHSIGRPEPMLIRTAKDNKDYTGGYNQYLTFGENMLKDFKF